MNRVIDRLKLVDNEISRRKESDKLAKYNSGEKIHKKQMEFHRCLKKNRWVFGGNRSGKTECGAVEAVWLARGIHPFRENKKDVSGWVVSLSKQVQRDVAQAKVLHYLRPDFIEKIVMTSGRSDSAENGIIDFILVKNVFGGLSKIGFKSCDQGREKFQGSSLDFVWFDEEPPFDIYQECRMRVLDREGIVFGTMTPLKGLTWVYNQIYLNEMDDDEVWYTQMEWADNPYLNKKELESLTSSLSQEELESRRYGKFMQSGGMVYSEFDESIHVIEPFTVPIEWYDNISIDPGLNNPLSAHWYAVDFDGNVYVIEEHFEKGKDVDYHASKIKEKSARLNWHYTNGGMIGALIDSAANQRTLASRKNVVELFYENGILANPKVNKDLFSGISVVKRFLRDANGRPHLFIFKNCVNLIREIKGYFWGEGDRPVKSDDHCLDEMRYYLMSRPNLGGGTSFSNQKSLVTKDKETLIRNIRKSMRNLK